MSDEDNPSPIGTTIYRIKKDARVTLKPSRKTRTKTRKPKFLSLLCLDLSPENNPTSEMTSIHKQQLNLFPLHPENLVEDKDPHDENMAYFFSAEDGGDTTTLTGLLGATDDSSSDENNNSLSPSSLKYACVGENGELLRTAMRNKERDASEDKWVFYSEVVERKDEEVTSCAADARCQIDQTRRLSLKLDYQEIMNAWSDKGSLYINAESPQTVPELHNDILSPDDATNGLKDGWRSNGGLWTVPEYNVSNGNSSMDIKEDVEGGEKWKYRHREASVLRYKEKRQSRLFAKKIRYQVRKLNAEKRPRVKGRFVKRD